MFSTSLPPPSANAGSTIYAPTTDLARRALEQILHDGRVPVAIQPIRGPGISTDQQWGEMLARPTYAGQDVAPQQVAGWAEQWGMAVAFDRIVLREAVGILQCARRIRWLGVNLTGSTLSSREPVADYVLDVLAECNTEPERLVLEISEAAPILDFGRARDILNPLRAAGVRVAIDDFGAGYSHLQLVHDGLVDIIKLDRAFLRADCAPAGIDPLRVVRSMKAMTDSLGADLVIEGVETEHHRRALAPLPSLHLQGFALGRPRLWRPDALPLHA